MVCFLPFALTLITLLLTTQVTQIPPSSSNANPSGNSPKPNSATTILFDRSPLDDTSNRERQREKVSLTYKCPVIG